MASEVQAQIIYKLYYKKSLQSAIKAHFDRRRCLMPTYVGRDENRIKSDVS